MTIDVWPALEVDIPRRGGKSQRREAEEAIREAADAHDKVYVVDRQGMRRNKPDIDLYQDVADAAEVWVDAGPRYAEDVVDLFIAGAHHVVVRWHTLHAGAELGSAADMSGDLSLGVEFQGKEFLENPREEATGLEPLLDEVRRMDMDLLVAGHPGESGGLACRHHAHAVRGFDGVKRYMGPVDGDDQERLGQEGFSGCFVDWSILRGEEEVWGGADPF